MKKLYVPFCLMLVCLTAACSHTETCDLEWSFDNELNAPEIQLFGETWSIDLGNPYTVVSKETFTRLHNSGQLTLFEATETENLYLWKVPAQDEMLPSGIAEEILISDFSIGDSNILNIAPFKNCRNLVIDYPAGVIHVNSDTVPHRRKGAPLRYIFDGEYGDILEAELTWNGEKQWTYIDSNLFMNSVPFETVSEEQERAVYSGEWIPDIELKPSLIKKGSMKIGSHTFESMHYLQSDTDLHLMDNPYSRKFTWFRYTLCGRFFWYDKVTVDLDHMRLFVE